MADQQKETLASLLMRMSDDQIDRTMHALLSRWDEPPTAIQVLEVLDHCIHGALASGFVVRTLQVVYDAALEREGKTHGDLIPLATWRDRGPAT